MRPADFPAAGLSGPGGGSVVCSRPGSGCAPGRGWRARACRSWRSASRRSSMLADASSRSRGGAGAVRARRGRGFCGPRARGGCGRWRRGARTCAAAPGPCVRRGVARDRVADARDDAVAGDQGGADGDQHGALGVVAEHAGASRAWRSAACATADSVWWTARVRAALARRRFGLRGAACGALRLCGRFSRAALRGLWCCGLGSGGGGGHLEWVSSSSSPVRGGTGLCCSVARYPFGGIEHLFVTRSRRSLQRDPSTA